MGRAPCQILFAQQHRAKHCAELIVPSFGWLTFSYWRTCVSIHVRLAQEISFVVGEGAVPHAHRNNAFAVALSISTWARQVTSSEVLLCSPSYGPPSPP